MLRLIAILQCCTHITQLQFMLMWCTYAVYWHGTYLLIHKIFRTLQEQNMQLMENLKSTDAQLSEVVAQKENLSSECQQRKATEEALRCLLQKKEKEASELQQAFDRKCQHLRDVAAFAAVSDPWLNCLVLIVYCACRLYEYSVFFMYCRLLIQLDKVQDRLSGTTWGLDTRPKAARLLKSFL